MTITIDIKELLKYESDMKEWGINRAMNIENMFSTHSAFPFTDARDINSIRNSIMSWDKNNPPPTLIPKV